MDDVDGVDVGDGFDVDGVDVDVDDVLIVTRPNCDLGSSCELICGMNVKQLTFD